jgi:DNA uptake protein ComE-like DNA-binding protein
MNRRTLRFLATLALLLACGPLARAQEDVAPTKKKTTSKAMQDAKAKAREQKNKDKAKLLDINQATKEQLKKLPGVTDAFADGIIAKRPYHSKAELLTKKAIPEVTYYGIRKLVAAK